MTFPNPFFFFIRLFKIMPASALVVLFLSLTTVPSLAGEDEEYVEFLPSTGSIALAEKGRPIPIVASSGDERGIAIAVNSLAEDVGRVTGTKPLVLRDQLPAAKAIVLIGTPEKNLFIRQLVDQNKLNVDAIKGKWEASLTQLVEHPFPGVEKALVIAGSDKRGTIFGIYDLSAKIGVSPWYWWADVPVKHHRDLYVKRGSFVRQPAVKYRGIFINDEAPALSGWTKEKFGGFNHRFYQQVFELILRLKGNYLWPAMWGNAFYDDDPENPRLANEMGIVIGTSHHEPMMRAHDEWRRYGKGAWNYTTNADTLRQFWRKGLRRMGNNESVVTIGMRGDGDEPMSQESNISLLEQIVSDQRSIMEEVTGKPASETPQLWALYKEVQDYYDKGMRVPDDVTLLLCDDNWGNIRKLPKLGEPQRKGGYGVYYHFDYVGGPRNYKWLNTNPISKVWEQMHLARKYGADRLWLVNVGDIKPMEFPIQFFLDYAWNPESIAPEQLQSYTENWARRQFGGPHSAEIAQIISAYTKYNGRRKPELLDDRTYSLTNYREFERVTAEYKSLLERAERVATMLAPEYRDAYFQLVLHPVKACSNLYELYYTVARNHLYAQQGRAATNRLADQVKVLFDNDAAISRYYNTSLAGGKWNHMMGQTHIGYTYWQQPERDVMPAVKKISIPAAAGPAFSVEGSEQYWPVSKEEAVLPKFSSLFPDSRYIELFNRGKAPYAYHVTAGKPWLKISAPRGTVDQEKRVWLSVEWKDVPAGLHQVPITITLEGGSYTLRAIVDKARLKPEKGLFAERDGYISIEAAHYSRAFAQDSLSWKILPDHGRTASALTTFPVTAPPALPGNSSPYVEYAIWLSSPGPVKVSCYFSPSLDFRNEGGLRYAVSIDDEKPQVLKLEGDNSERAWNRAVAENIRIVTSEHGVKSAGKHVLKFWRVDPAVVLQKVVLDAGGLKPSYLGPPETRLGAAEPLGVASHR